MPFVFAPTQTGTPADEPGQLRIDFGGCSVRVRILFGSLLFMRICEYNCIRIDRYNNRQNVFRLVEVWFGSVRYGTAWLGLEISVR
jgi:hypothetical protein